MRGSVPRTLGELRRASILLTLHLQRAEIAASWYCERARIEVLLEGADAPANYLDRGDVGWLSRDEPPRRSPAFALQQRRVAAARAASASTPKLRRRGTRSSRNRDTASVRCPP